MGDSSLVGELQSNMTMAVLIPCKMFNWSIQNVESSSKIILSTSEVSDWRGFTSWTNRPIGLQRQTLRKIFKNYYNWKRMKILVKKWVRGPRDELREASPSSSPPSSPSSIDSGISKHPVRLGYKPRLIIVVADFCEGVYCSSTLLWWMITVVE